MTRSAIFNTAIALVVVTTGTTSALGGTFFGHPNGLITGGSRWDAAPRLFGGNERSLDGGLRYSLQGGSFGAYRDLFQWNVVPTVAEFQLAIAQAFAAWESPDPVTGLSTQLSFIADLTTPVVGTGEFSTGDPAGAEIDLLAVDAGFSAIRAQVFFDTTDSTVQLTSGTVDFPGSKAITGADIKFNNNPDTRYTLDVFRRLLTHEIGHTLGLGDVDAGDSWMQFIDDNYDGSTSATALTTLTNSWALLVDPLNPAASPLSVYQAPPADPGTNTPGVDILMESNGLGGSLANPYSNLLPLRNDDYGMRQFLYPSLNFAFSPGDFNRDGSVDAADYVTWRNELPTTFVETDYNVWRANYGATVNFAASHVAAVPEPVTLIVLAAGLCGLAWSRLRRTFSAHDQSAQTRHPRYPDGAPTNGFDRFSRPIVVSGPWPGSTSVSSGSLKSFS